ncbi:MAG: sugar ABC transporter permease, partial [Anaerolineae bacterium]|nr:sugar ABC transporter permease [Anaerolineae bacterium]
MTTTKNPTRRVAKAKPAKYVHSRPQTIMRMYSYWFYVPALIVFGIFFLLPTALAFYFSLTRWTLFDTTFIGFENYELFFRDPQLSKAFINTFIYAFITSGMKVV